MAGRRANGEGTIYRRQDGRYEAAAYFLTVSGKRKRLRVYGKTREEVHTKLTDSQAQAQRGVPVPDRNWRLGEYLEYWLEHVVRVHRRPATYSLYETIIRLYLEPGLGTQSLSSLSVHTVQSFLNDHLTRGHSVRKTQAMRAVLGAALTRAQREELITRNVARLVELPTWERAEVRPWTLAEAKDFLRAARSHQLYPAFVVLMLYGLRRGELLGLRWEDLDCEAGILRVRQQLQRLNHQLVVGPLKTRAGRRDLPLVELARDALVVQRSQQAGLRQTAGSAWKGCRTAQGLIFTTRTGRPIDPQDFVRSFKQVCTAHGLRLITVHHVRHTAATLLKSVGVPVRDAQLILGHSRIVTTQEIYQHDDLEGRRRSLGKLEALFLREVSSSRCRHLTATAASIVDRFTTVLPGGAWRARTADLLHAMSPKAGIFARTQSVKATMQDRCRQWVLGCVAVKCSRQIFLDYPPEETPCSAA